MSDICKLKIPTYWDQLCVSSTPHEEFLSNTRIPSLSSISTSDLDNSDLSTENNILGDMSNMSVEFDLRECQESKFQISSKLNGPNQNVPSDTNSVCDQLNKFDNMNSKSLCIDSHLKKEHKQKSVSLHDISNFPSSLMNLNSHGISSETLHSHSVSSTIKSKDSGIHRSTSCLSLTSGNRSYEHVQSKVKQYIQNIKDAETQRKKCSHQDTPIKRLISSAPVINNSEDPEKLKHKICKLEFELKEMSILLDTQQEQYNTLLYKYAEAKNIIDSIRLKRINLSYNNTISDSHIMHSSNSFHNGSTNLFNNTIINYKETDPSINAESVFNNTALDSSAKIFPKHSTPLTSPNQVKNILGPVSSIFSSSSRLDKQFIPLLKHDINSNENESKQSETSSQGQESARIKNYCNHSKSSTLSNQQKLKKESVQPIDLPKVAPFDKVKKWQESLPSIDLLDTCSLSNSDTSDTSMINNYDFNILDSSEVKCGQLTKHEIKEKQKAESNLKSKYPKKSLKEGFNNALNEVKCYNSSNSFNSGDRRKSCSKSPKIVEEQLSVPLSKLSINDDTYCKSHKPDSCNEQNNNILNINCKCVNQCEKFNDQLSNCAHQSEELTEYNKKPGFFLSKQEISFKTNSERSLISPNADETTSDDELSSYFPNSSTLSVDKNLKQLVKSEDSSSVSSSVLDSVDEFYSFVQKKSPKRKVNCLNYYSPCKIPKIKETSNPSCVVGSSTFKLKSDIAPKILRESRLNHLFPTNSASKVTHKIQVIDNSDDNYCTWKNNFSTEYKKSSNLPESLEDADHFVTIALKKVESTLSNIKYSTS